MASGDEPEPKEAKPKRLYSLGAKVLLGLGLLQLYNIVAYRQGIIDLSQSFHLLAAWWRYVTGLPFNWLGIHYPPLQRDILILCLLFVAAANFAWKRGKGYSIPTAMWRLGKFGLYHPSVRDEIYNARAGVSGAPFTGADFVVGIVLMMALPLALFLNLPSIVWITFLMVPTAIILIRAAIVYVRYILFYLMVRHRSRIITKYKLTRRSIFSDATEEALAPMAIYCSFFLMIASYRLVFFKTCGWLVVILTADPTARYALDPLMAMIPQIPMPPTSDV